MLATRTADLEHAPDEFRLLRRKCAALGSGKVSWTLPPLRSQNLSCGIVQPRAPGRAVRSAALGPSLGRRGGRGAPRPRAPLLLREEQVWLKPSIADRRAAHNHGGSPIKYDGVALLFGSRTITVRLMPVGPSYAVAGLFLQGAWAHLAGHEPAE